jgi:hypothetical protein
MAKLVPFFGTEVAKDGLVTLFYHVPLAGEADASGGVVQSGGRWLGGGRLKWYNSAAPGDPEDRRYVGWREFDTEEAATAFVLDTLEEVRAVRGGMEKERGVEHFPETLLRPRKPLREFVRWMAENLPCFHRRPDVDRAALCDWRAACAELAGTCAGTGLAFNALVGSWCFAAMGPSDGKGLPPVPPPVNKVAFDRWMACCDEFRCRCPDLKETVEIELQGWRFAACPPADKRMWDFFHNMAEVARKNKDKANLN